ncbi:MAG: Oligopeptide transport system permease protein OppB [Spirochaetes bacterium ADurb.Bin315]|mgnify:CR=1 FL=1|jgi:oligopeptide transport system permease protein|nr:oligopeptide ABC transporter permease OppB [Spirochaetota bacterium]NLL25295.1 oligopeptide ABC transporter permease OppB [Spirochaetales bacterium]OQA42834.1 MAG: Oligopeptide transport system permease protein OppB [Spirochaetes bacterium ADurb.Bin315]HPY44505.1 oligopeptide ABC transporter permease OppB [Sphaerochaeta sp.]HQB05586.1 oligopeptide ABC transporter permease OppB [Sphaerochaeta sp.]
MTKYIVNRLLGMIPTLFIIITLSFFIVRIAPGGPLSAERNLTDVVRRNIEAKYHLDEPLIKQYGRYMFDIMRGDLGPSFKYKDYDVNYYIFTSLPKSIVLGLWAMLISVTIGMGIGIIAAVRQNSWIDYLSMGLAVIGISVPLFVIAPVLQLIFAVKLKWLPTSGWYTTGEGYLTIILPAVSLSFEYFANIARLTRSSMLETLRSDYIRTAKAKGMKRSAIIFKHAMKGALLPVVSYLGPAFAGIITGSVVVEQIFRVPGLGKFFVQSSFNRDYTLIVGVVIVYSVILIVMNFIVDIIYAQLDPRITYK